MKEPSLTIGIEEEYLLVDLETRDLVRDPPKDLMAQCQELLRDQVAGEFLKSQIEVGTTVCRNIGEARVDLKRLRRCIAEVAAGYGMAPMAASTHPFARWTEQEHTEKERYDILARDLAGVIRRLLIGGMHVHAGIEDEELRIDLMNQVTYFLPHLLALTTSSPFWIGEDMGMMSYRLAVLDAVPRTGLPDFFNSASEYERLLGQMESAGLIEDRTKLWWDVRPSARFPTLEVRIMDVCTRIEDGLCVAALYQSLLSMLTRLRRENKRWRIYPRTLIQENRWRAQRYGVNGEMVDFGVGALVPFAELVDELIELVREDAERLDCLAEVERARTIAAEGTSANRQLSAYNDAIDGGAEPQEALRAVVDFLIEETVAGTDGQD